MKARSLDGSSPKRNTRFSISSRETMRERPNQAPMAAS